MKVSVITVPLMGECICFKTKTLFESIYAVRNPYKAHKLPNYERLRNSVTCGLCKDYGQRI